ncbi:Peptidase family C25 [Algoriphagus faecimaris]|uniref:Peptidase family C25 n=1 Tax=Algoriphagus faecimaris TaxID=686796 RepID=A0A1G6REZ3_9BACT|nr:type IX secretion system sortase PorU [Algoriphagus faecimaris]SDD02597.1 Peptidase family C25 [Algoriphagus faecimaris]
MILFSNRRLLLGVLFFLFFHSKAKGQDQYFRFSVQEKGLYLFSKDHLSILGGSDFSNVAFYGFPGSLPQKLDSSAFSLHQIPALETEEGLLVYLEGANQMVDSLGELSYRHHHFTDELSYLIGFEEKPTRISAQTPDNSSSTASTMYKWEALKIEAINLLNSGRTWYSDPIRAGGSRSFGFDLQSESSAPWKIQGVLMGASTSGGSFDIFEKENQIHTVEIASIPETTYGLKGVSKHFKVEFSPEGKSMSSLRLAYQSSSSGSSGYLDYLMVGMPVEAVNPPSGIYFLRQNHSTVHPSSQQFMWDISDFFRPIRIEHTGNPIEISASKIALFTEKDIRKIENITPVNSSLRQSSAWPELLIVSPKSLANAAEKLSLHKLSQGIYTEWVALENIYEEFGYGNPDLIAIRNFLAWHFHQGKTLKNVLLLGKGTFDYKGKLGGRPNLLPIYTSRNSLNPLTTFSSDDFFGLLDLGQGEWQEDREGDEVLQIGVGRLPVITSQEADVVVKKIIDYESGFSGIQWKKNFTLMADDADNNIHVRDAESHSQYSLEKAPDFTQNKLYLDLFEQIAEEGSQSSPDAKEALKKTLDKGTLFLNYIGHGNETTLTAEQVFRVEDLQDWPAQRHLPLWITATCEFGRHDSPFIRSAAEELLTIPDKGAIGLLTTGRPVFSSVNFALNQAFIQTVFEKENGAFQDLGSIFLKTKNRSLNGPFNRNFSLLGDPSMRLAAPNYEVRLISLNDPEEMELESLSGNQIVQYEADIWDPIANQSVENFDGEVTVQLWDRLKTSRTLGDESSPIEFSEEKTLLFQGEAKVENGKIHGRLRVPSQISTDLERGSLRFFAIDSLRERDAAGSSKPLLGGEAIPESFDDVGPKISLFMENKEVVPLSTFKSRLIPTEITFFDSSGIDVSGLDPEKILSLQLNSNPEINLNQLFKAKKGDFIEGIVKLKLEDLVEGKNQIRIQAYDLAGNRNILELEFILEGTDRLRILSHKTFPNPASSESHFEIRHNRAGENLMMRLEVFNLEGKILYSESLRLVEAGAVIGDLSWIFLQNQTKYPAKGTYIYKLALQSEVDQTMDIASGQIVIE